MEESDARRFADQFEIEVDEAGLLDSLTRRQVGQLATDLVTVRAVVKGSASVEERQQFDEWARQRIYLLALTGGVEADGWFQGSDGHWRLTATLREMPEDPFTT